MVLSVYAEIREVTVSLGHEHPVAIQCGAFGRIDEK
jgi:hypothetical protein